MKADGVISGLAIAKRVYEKFEKDILWDAKVKDGDRVKRRYYPAYRSQLPLPLIRRKAFAEHLATHVGHRYGNGQIRRRISRYSHHYWTPGKQLRAYGYWTKWPLKTEERPTTGWDYTIWP